MKNAAALKAKMQNTIKGLLYSVQLRGFRLLLPTTYESVSAEILSYSDGLDTWRRKSKLWNSEFVEPLG
eukprot:CAMPEP_0185584570 /NCGR_PEP_ID=MMETSP0434-20130131/33155_1 /TAXON_ID=626734 ORGANISM="Favella taraikaensis, Strain Fe Narragansett Bay" /NCGR_SAMPLE_ID=MMETSP0434 /ASSEMBLY_ACC=CAM_ASM_000379 /LENGTH=68 /DNA_ID=CAMNT_0028204409 /DNA_START=2020 /DNA_END=2222 /DNA_ORIENTATION=+